MDHADRIRQNQDVLGVSDYSTVSITQLEGLITARFPARPSIDDERRLHPHVEWLASRLCGVDTDEQAMITVIKHWHECLGELGYRVEDMVKVFRTRHKELSRRVPETRPGLERERLAMRFALGMEVRPPSPLVPWSRPPEWGSPSPDQPESPMDFVAPATRAVSDDESGTAMAQQRGAIPGSQTTTSIVISDDESDPAPGPVQSANEQSQPKGTIVISDDENGPGQSSMKGATTKHQIADRPVGRWLFDAPAGGSASGYRTTPPALQTPVLPAPALPALTLRTYSSTKGPLPSYLCNRCNVPGHLIRNCPTNLFPEYDQKPPANYRCAGCGSNNHLHTACPRNKRYDSINQQRIRAGIPRRVTPPPAEFDAEMYGEDPQRPAPRGGTAPSVGRPDENQPAESSRGRLQSDSSYRRAASPRGRGHGHRSRSPRRSGSPVATRKALQDLGNRPRVVPRSGYPDERNEDRNQRSGYNRNDWLDGESMEGYQVEPVPHRDNSRRDLPFPTRYHQAEGRLSFLDESEDTLIARPNQHTGRLSYHDYDGNEFDIVSPRLEPETRKDTRSYFVDSEDDFPVAAGQVSSHPNQRLSTMATHPDCITMIDSHPAYGAAHPDRMKLIGSHPAYGDAHPDRMKLIDSFSPSGTPQPAEVQAPIWNSDGTYNHVRNPDPNYGKNLEDWIHGVVDEFLEQQASTSPDPPTVMASKQTIAQKPQEKVARRMKNKKKGPVIQKKDLLAAIARSQSPSIANTEKPSPITSTDNPNHAKALELLKGNHNPNSRKNKARPTAMQMWDESDRSKSAAQGDAGQSSNEDTPMADAVVSAAEAISLPSALYPIEEVAEEFLPDERGFTKKTESLDDKRKVLGEEHKRHSTPIEAPTKDEELITSEIEAVHSVQAMSQLSLSLSPARSPEKFDRGLDSGGQNDL